MKATGIVRRVDDIGRVLITKDILRMINVANGDPLEFSIEGQKIVLQKHVAVNDFKSTIHSLKKNISEENYINPEIQKALCSLMDSALDILETSYVK